MNVGIQWGAEVPADGRSGEMVLRQDRDVLEGLGDSCSGEARVGLRRIRISNRDRRNCILAL